MLLSARKLCGIFGNLVCKPNQMQQFTNTIVFSGFWPSGAAQAITNIVGNAQIWKQRIGLEDYPKIALRWGQGRDVTASLDDAPHRWWIQTRNGAQ